MKQGETIRIRCLHTDGLTSIHTLVTMPFVKEGLIYLNEKHDSGSQLIMFPAERIHDIRVIK